MIRFSDYIWERVRGGILFFWLILTAISVVSYTCVVVYLKNRQLKSSLNVAAFTVHESVSAGDWTLALGHLKALEKSGPVFRIQLKNKGGGSNVTGPFGEKQFGVGSLCSEAPVGDQLILSGCMRVFGVTELYTAFLLLLLAGTVFFAAFRLFRSKMLAFVGQVSEELGSMRALRRGESAKRNELNRQSDIAEIASIRDYISGLLQETEKASEAQAKNQLSAQVAHDVRSPLTALNMAAEELQGLPESQRILIRSAVTRIQDIANSLMQQNDERAVSTGRPGASLPARAGLSNQLLSSLIDSIVSEKRVQYRSRLGIEIKGTIDASCYGVFARVDPAEFKRVLSNLINNAVEAISKGGRVDVCLASADDSVTLLVRDTGKGIPSEVLPRLMERGATFGKNGGSGLGLYHARTTVQGWGGDIAIDSHFGQGTTVRITLKKAPPPEWFVPELRLRSASTVVILDDDISIHQIWQKRLEELRAQDLDFRHFSTIEEIREWHGESRPKGRRVQYLIDYELLGESLNGLQIIEQLDIAEESIRTVSVNRAIDRRA